MSTMAKALILFIASVSLFSWSVNSFIFQDDTVCYHELGCFSSKAPFLSATRPLSVLPSDPKHIRANLQRGQLLDATQITNIRTQWTNFKDRKTQIIVHGFLDNVKYVSWFKTMKDELLKHGDYNVIIVDWHHGNNPPYTQATANSRVVGAQIALLIKKLGNEYNISMSRFHIVGHSLGAHVAGYAGERTMGLGRITGLDPAGPYFEGTDKEVRLVHTDADFVDVIHTDGSDILELGLGLLQPLGHMDFYPNFGHDQPGCKPSVSKSVSNLWNFGIVDGVEEIVGCNHLRSMRYFLESINSNCPFIAFPCSGEEAFKAHKCFSCPKDGSGCVTLGFHADQHKPSNGARGKYYTTTGGSDPFCQHHLVVKVKLGRPFQATDERGRAQIRLHGKTGSTVWLPLDHEPKNYIPGSTYELVVALQSSLGDILSMEFQWNHMSSITNPLKWNPFNLRKPKLYIDAVDILTPESQTETLFCAGDLSAENNEPTFVSTKC